MLLYIYDRTTIAKAAKGATENMAYGIPTFHLKELRVVGRYGAVTIDFNLSKNFSTGSQSLDTAFLASLLPGSLKTQAAFQVDGSGTLIFTLNVDLTNKGNLSTATKIEDLKTAGNMWNPTGVLSGDANFQVSLGSDLYSVNLARDKSYTLSGFGAGGFVRSHHPWCSASCPTSLWAALRANSASLCLSGIHAYVVTAASCVQLLPQ